jgi:hypothetical protein
MSALSRLASNRHEGAPRRGWQPGALAALVCAVVNLIIYFAVPALFNFSLDVPLMGPGSAVQQLPFYMVLVVSVLTSFGAAGVLAMLNRFTSRPITIFRIVAAVLLVLSLGAPFSLPVALNIRLTLAAMHLAAAAIITYFLTAWERAA